MSLHELADDTASKIIRSLGLADDKVAEVSRIVEDALVTAIQSTREGCVRTVNICCSPDQDLAHKIAEELAIKEKALIANLSSMR